MFAIESKTENGFEIIILKDLSANTSVEIIPSCGAMLHAFKIAQHGQVVNIIDSYESAADFKKNVEAKGFKSSKLSPFACRIKNSTYHFGEKEYQLNKFMLNGHAIHGLLYDVPFEVTYQYADDEHAGIALTHQYRGSYSGYPFWYDCVITYHLKKDNELIIGTDILNRDESLIPIQDGWHPYFSFGKKINELELQLNSSSKFVFDSDMMHKGETLSYKEFSDFKPLADNEFDDCFVLDFSKGQTVCRLRDRRLQLQLSITPDKNYPYLQIYTPPGRNCIAIENLSAPPDTFNNKIGLVILPPGANKFFTTTFTVTNL